ncbi:hypothetical protein QJS10_CPA08g01505 [Acorus calamus]|uniref:Sialyltransferase-like protein 1 n=1 Tax=Acorus calamus TaxID=4465 RepID=A0AAV9EEM8_ACOCL|nr:hypothetical protein QJS10_CPA08g01505 [Acorus calamus]
MKPSLRLPFLLLLLLALFTALSFHSLLRRPSIASIAAATPPVLRLNSTLLRLASVDANESSERKEVSDLLSASSFDSDPRHRSISSYRRRFHRPVRRPPAGDLSRIWPDFRRSLRGWFRDKRYDVSAMSRLLSQISLPRRYSSCAVVGNSGILLRSEHGRLIDSHEAVIRLNNARAAGFGRHVGEKTTIAFINSNILHLCARREGCHCNPYGDAVPIIMYMCQPIHFVDYAVCNASHRESPIVVTDPRFDVLCARIVKYYSMKRFVGETGRDVGEWSAAHDGRMFHYSSGMQAVMLAIGVCEKVSLFGFGKLEGAKHHYHTNQKAELSLHDYEAEYDLYGDLVERPETIPFLSESGFAVPPVVIYR